MNKYLLVLGFKKPVMGKLELHIPFDEGTNTLAEVKADGIIAIWQDNIVESRLYLLEEIQNWIEEK